MAQTTNATTAPTVSTMPPRLPVTPKAIGAGVAGWIVPGLGHFILGAWIRGLLLLFSVFVLFFAGLGMQGKVYGFNTGDLLEMLGFFGDAGAGMLYLLARAMDWGHGAIHRAVADYGTKYIIVAGLLNIISAVDAYHIAIGKKK